MPPDADDASATREWAAQIKEAGWTAIKTLDVDSMWQRYDPECREPAHEPLGRNLSAADLRRAERQMAHLRDGFREDVDISVHCHWALDLRDAIALKSAWRRGGPAGWRIRSR